MLVACSYAAPSPGILAAAPIVTATSSQVIARNYNAGLVAPVVAAAPLVAAAPVVRAAPLVAAPAFAAHTFAAPAYSPYTNLAYSGYPYII